MRVAVVGAGLGGLACAVALRDAGHEVAVFERAPALSEADSGLTLWSNGTLALRRLGVLDALTGRTAPLAVLHLRRRDGRPLMAIPTEAFSTPALGAHRADLHAALLARLPASAVHPGVLCRGVRETPGGVVVEGAAEVPFDLAVAADGARSALRSYACGSDAPRYMGYTIFRGTAALDRPPLPAGVLSETWGRGMRFGLFRMSPGRWCWYAALDRPEGSLLPPERRREELLRAFASWSGPAPAVIAASGGILQNDAYARAPAPRWSRGRVVLTGDAAHPMPPNLGQGACMVLEDAVHLGGLLAGAADPGPALRRFEADRRGRVYGIAARSRRIGALAQWRDPWLTWGRDAVTRLVPGRWLTLTSRRIHSYGSADAPSPQPRRGVSSRARPRHSFP